jgi:hypothetical protein
MRRSLFSAALLWACTSEGPAGSCALPPLDGQGYLTCIDYPGTRFTSNSIKAACASAAGTYSADPCAPGDAGVCVFSKGSTADEYSNVYSGDGSDAGVDLGTVCTMHSGTFSSG